MARSTLPVAPRFVRWGWAAVFLVWSLCAIFTVWLAAQPGHVHARDHILYLVTMSLAAATVCTRAVLGRVDRLAWFAVGAAIGLSVLGEVVLAVEPTTVPVPGPADGFFLAFYPLTYVGLISLVRPHLGGVTRSMWLDGALAASSSLAVVAAVIYRPVATEAAGSASELVLAYAYPLFDVILALSAGAVLVTLGRATPAWLMLLGAGMAVLALADILYAAPVSAGAYVEGSMTDALWPLSSALIASAAWCRPRSGVARPTPGWLVHSAPMIGTGLVGAVLIRGAWATLPPLVVLLASVGLVLGVVRLHLTSIELRRLAIDNQLLTSRDRLTGLANRRSLEASAEPVLAAATTSRPVSLLLADLDSFNQVNESLGHRAGDELLRVVAGRLASCLRSPADQIARLDGDEFAFVLPDTDEAGVSALLGRIRASLQVPAAIRGVDITASVSVGVAVAPSDGADLGLLLRRADIALHRAKATPNGSARFDQANGDIDLEGRIQQVAELRSALVDGEFEVHYQPQVCTRTGRTVAVEALVRWRKPGSEDLVPPGRFLPVIQQAGLMPELTWQVLGRATMDAAGWRAAGLKAAVAVNLPPAALSHPDLLGNLTDALSRSGLPAHHLTLEITEDAYVADPLAATGLLHRIRASGIQVSVDDFGTGYSALTYLNVLPLDELKLDRAFVSQMTRDARAAAIVRSTIQLGHALDLRVVAEGVETAEIAHALVDQGCDLLQGFLYSPAVPSGELLPWIAQHEAAHAI